MIRLLIELLNLYKDDELVHCVVGIISKILLELHLSRFLDSRELGQREFYIEFLERSLEHILNRLGDTKFTRDIREVLGDVRNLQATSTEVSVYMVGEKYYSFLHFMHELVHSICNELEDFEILSVKQREFFLNCLENNGNLLSKLRCRENGLHDRYFFDINFQEILDLFVLERRINTKISEGEKFPEEIKQANELRNKLEDQLPEEVPLMFDDPCAKNVIEILCRLSKFSSLE